MILVEHQLTDHLLPKYDFPDFLCNKSYPDFESNSSNQHKNIIHGKCSIPQILQLIYS
jgi:hypothetical protein